MFSQDSGLEGHTLDIFKPHSGPDLPRGGGCPFAARSQTIISPNTPWVCGADTITLLLALKWEPPDLEL